MNKPVIIPESLDLLRKKIVDIGSSRAIDRRDVNAIAATGEVDGEQVHCGVLIFNRFGKMTHISTRAGIGENAALGMSRSEFKASIGLALRKGLFTIGDLAVMAPGA